MKQMPALEAHNLRIVLHDIESRVIWGRIAIDYRQKHLEEREKEESYEHRYNVGKQY